MTNSENVIKEIIAVEQDIVDLILTSSSVHSADNLFSTENLCNQFVSTQFSHVGDCFRK